MNRTSAGCCLIAIFATSSNAAELTPGAVADIYAASRVTRWSSIIGGQDSLRMHQNKLHKELNPDWVQWLPRTQGLAIGYHDGRALIAIPGTQDPVEWRIQQHGDVSNVLSGNTKAHRGFAIAAAAATPELLELISSKHITNITCTGFSAGAATSLYTAFNLISSQDESALQVKRFTIITIGCPHVATPSFCRAMTRLAKRRRVDIYELLTCHQPSNIDPVANGWRDILLTSKQSATAKQIRGIGQSIYLESPPNNELHELPAYLSGIDRLNNGSVSHIRQRGHIVPLTTANTRTTSLNMAKQRKVTKN